MPVGTGMWESAFAAVMYLPGRLGRIAPLDGIGAPGMIAQSRTRCYRERKDACLPASSDFGPAVCKG